MSRSPNELKCWAHEHLVYEADMLQLAVLKASDPDLSPRERNAFIESFAIRVRCLREFLWTDYRDRNHPDDARAWDFCAAAVWADVRPALPKEIAEIEGKRNRIGREIVHLSYHRLDIAAEAKQWDMSGLLRVIADALARFAEVAEPQTLAPKTRQFFATLWSGLEYKIPPSLLTGHVRGVAVATQAAANDMRGTQSVPGYSADDVGPGSS